MLIYNENMSKIVNFDNIRYLSIVPDSDYFEFGYRLYADDYDLGGYRTRQDGECMIGLIFEALNNQEQAFYLRSGEDYYSNLTLEETDGQKDT